MDATDRKLLNLIQKGIPLVPNPFATLGDRLGISQGEVLERLEELKHHGIIRRMGAFFDPLKMGYASTLCAARCPDDKEQDFISAVNALPEVTHNYRRTGEYNIWFTIIAPSKEEINRLVSLLKEQTGVEDILSMKINRRFKIDAKFEV